MREGVDNAGDLEDYVLVEMQGERKVVKLQSWIATTNLGLLEESMEVAEECQ